MQLPTQLVSTLQSIDSYIIKPIVYVLKNYVFLEDFVRNLLLCLEITKRKYVSSYNNSFVAK